MKTFFIIAILIELFYIAAVAVLIHRFRKEINMVLTIITEFFLVSISTMLILFIVLYVQHPEHFPTIIILNHK